ncbi:MAG: hypothetical protein ACRDPH_11715 [Marmoricola sp.]
MRAHVTDAVRGLAGAGVLLSAVVHLDLYAAGYGTITTIGPLFLLNAVAGLVLGVLVVSWASWIPAVLAAGFGAATVAAYWFSVVHGLFGVREVTGGWAVIMAEVAEYVAIGCGLGAAVLLRNRRAAIGRPEPPR